MKKQQLRLLEILKSDSELKKEIEELKLGCWIEFDWWKVGQYDRTFQWYWIDKVFWQANYQHLLRYLKKDFDWISLDWNWQIVQIIMDSEWDIFDACDEDICFDIKKDLLENSEETLEKLCDYLETLTK